MDKHLAIYLFLLAASIAPQLCIAQQHIDTAKVYQLNEVTVKSAYKARAGNLYQYDRNQFGSIVTLIGETDVLRYIATLPGVAQGMEGGMSYYIRGGGNGNNRFELDGIPVYGNTHLFGIFSVFHPDIISEVNFYSGGIPSSTGNLLASVTQLSTEKEITKTTGTFSISPFMLGGSLNGIISKNRRWTYQAAVRTSLLRAEYILARKFAKEVEGDVNPSVSDAFLKVNYQHRKHHLAIGGYWSNDYLNYEEDNNFSINWSNQIVYLKHTYSLNEKSCIKTDVYYNNFVSGQKEDNYLDEKLTSKLRMHSGLHEYTLRTQFLSQWKNLSYNMGLQETLQKLTPVTEKFMSSTQSASRYRESPTSNTLSAFAEGTYTQKYTSITLGVRGNLYASQGYNAFIPDVHLSIKQYLTSDLRFIASVDRMSQYNHIVEGLPIGWSLDLSVPANAAFKPETAWQGYAGLIFNSKGWTLSAGGYYKRMENLTSYSNPANVFYKDMNWHEEVIVGKGKSYGMEIRLEKRGDSFNTSLSYTWSKTFRQFDEINEGKEFPFKFDRRHVLSATAQLRIIHHHKHQQWLNLGINASSGHRMTIAKGTYEGVLPPFWDLHSSSGIGVSDKEEDNAWTRQQMGAMNGYLLPAYFRTDIGYEFRTHGKKTEKSLTIGIYNVFNRKNPYLIFYEDNRWKQLSILPIIPSISWSIRF